VYTLKLIRLLFKECIKLNLIKTNIYFVLNKTYIILIKAANKLAHGTDFNPLETN